MMEKMEEIAMDLVVAELLWGLLEVACQLADVVDVSSRWSWASGCVAEGLR